MNSNIIYDDKNDNLYILIYKLGKGACATVWFAVEFNKFLLTIKQKKLNISYKALKIHNPEDFEEGILETKIIELLPKNHLNSEFINYPISHFIMEENIVIVIYDVAIGSLYDLLKIYGKDLPKDFIIKIIPQMINSIDFLHKNGYVHTDIKPENFLLVGTTKFQDEIINFIRNYNLYSKFKLTKKIVLNKKNMMNIINEPIYNMLNDLSLQFEIIDNLVGCEENSSDEENSEENLSDNEQSDNEHSDNKNKNNKNNKNNNKSNLIEEDSSEKKLNSNDDVSESTENNDFDNNDEEESIEDNSDYDTDNSTCSTYNSHRNEYFIIHDKFNINKILKIENNNNSSENDESENDESENIDNYNNENKKFIKKYIENPKILLMDFGLIQKQGSGTRTIQTRYYRSPEVLFGLKYDNKIDLWALGCSLYELITGDILINVEKSEYNEIYDKDLIHLKFLIEKIEMYGFENIKKLASISPRKSYLLNDDNTLKFFREIIYDNWKNNEKIKEIDSQVIELIDGLLQINPQTRKINDYQNLQNLELIYSSNWNLTK